MSNDKNKKRVGILTMYYNSANYGGLLQAYALVRYLNNKGVEAKQITYDFSRITININIPNRKWKSTFVLKTKKLIKSVLNEGSNIVHGLIGLKKIRRDACKEFRDNIPHTQDIYTVDTLKRANDEFDVFITGSDQVWNPNGYRPGFFLTFVDGKQKRKIAYAASVSNKISPNALEVYTRALKDFDVISVRERADISQIRKTTENQVLWAVDPVFLLTKEDWSSVAAGIKDIVSKPYIFCYFLGDSVKQRVAASEYASAKHLKIVTIPYMQMNYRECDRGFGDVRLLKVSPNHFLGLIENAECIFTDSFHATAFSIIFRKEFVVFERSGHPEMIERIRSLIQLFKCNDNFIHEEKITVECLAEVLSKNDLQYESEEFTHLLTLSKRILEI